MTLSSLRPVLLIAAVCLAAGCRSAAEPSAPSPAEAAIAEYRLGDKAFEAMDFDKAMAHYARSLELDSTQAQAYLGRGRIYWFSQHFDRAVPELDRALALDANLPWAYYFRGISRLNLQDFENGIADLTEAVATESLPTDFIVKARHFRAIGYMNLQQPDQAIADVSACIEMEPDQPMYRYERATLYESLGRTAEAITDYESFLVINDLAAREATAEAPSADHLERMEHVRQKLASLRGGV